MRERWAAGEAALRQAPFPIVGLAPPFRGPVSLGSLETGNGQVVSVGLLYGETGLHPGPRVTVCTAAASADRGSHRGADLAANLLREFDGDAEDSSPKLGSRTSPRFCSTACRSRCTRSTTAVRGRQSLSPRLTAFPCWLRSPRVAGPCPRLPWPVSMI